MLKTLLIAATALAVAAPAALAKSAPKKDVAAVSDGPPSPIPYSQLAAEDEKLNGKGGMAKHHHMAKKKEAPAAAKPAQ